MDTCGLKRGDCRLETGVVAAIGDVLVSTRGKLALGSIQCRDRFRNEDVVGHPHLRSIDGNLARQYWTA
jgi:hypothetical protein